MKKIISISLTTLALLALTACNQPGMGKCSSGKCDSAQKCQSSGKCDTGKKCQSSGKCSSGKCGS